MSRMDDYNYENDSRVIAGRRGAWYKVLNLRTKTATVEYFDENGDECEAEVPYKNAVCPTCDGEGSHVNPSIDAGGITASEWEEEWDDEDRDAYMSGMYDIPCCECHGNKVVPVIDRDAADPAIVQALDDAEQAREECERESRYERMMGA